MKHVSDKYENYNIPDNPDKFIKWLLSEIEKTGVAKDKVSVGISVEDVYDSITPYLTLSYEREETAAEIADRELCLKRREELDRRTFKRLKAKFEQGE